MRYHHIILFVLFIIANAGCKAFEEYRIMTEADRKLAAFGISPEQYQTDVKRGEVQRNVERTLYVGMPKEEFVECFARSAEKEHLDESYVKDCTDNQCILLEFPSQNEKARVTFQDGKLVKFERYGTGSNPWGYADETYMLKGPSAK